MPALNSCLDLTLQLGAGRLQTRWNVGVEVRGYRYLMSLALIEETVTVIYLAQRCSTLEKVINSTGLVTVIVLAQF